MGASAGTLKALLTLENQPFLKAMGEANTAVETGTRDQAAAFGQLSNVMGGLGAALAGGAAFAAVFDTLGDSLEIAEKVDRLHNSFVVLNGATADTEKFFKEISDIEKQSNFDFEDTLGPAAAKMLALGVNTNDATKYMHAFVDIAAGLNLKPENIEGMAAAFGKINKEAELTPKHIKLLEKEGVPATKLLADALGITLAEATDKVAAKAISAKDALNLITTEAETRFKGEAMKAVGTFAGVVNQLGQAVEDLKVAIGEHLLDVFNDFKGDLLYLISKISEFAGWFDKLPTPVKDFAVAFALLAPIAVTLAGAVALLPAAFAALGTALAGPALPLAALAAALVAFGLWVHENWDPIVATLKQGMLDVQLIWQSVSGWIDSWWSGIWEGLKEIFDSVATPFMQMLSLIWDVYTAPWKLLWEGISSWITALWQGIETVGKPIWEGITSAIGGFTEAAKLIPGVKGLMNLDETWKSAQKLKEEHEAAAKAAEDLANAAKKAKPDLDKLTQTHTSQAEAAKAAKEAAKEMGQAYSKLGLKDREKEVKDLKDALDKLKKSGDFAKLSADDQKTATDKLANAEYAASQKTVNWSDEILKLNKHLGDWKTAQNLLNIELDNGQRDMDALAQTVTDAIPKLPLLIQQVDAWERSQTYLEISVNNTNAAYKKLGLESPADVRSARDEIQKAYDDILASGTATPAQIQAAWKAAHDAMAAETVTKKGTLEGHFGDLAKNVSTVITNFAQGISDSLWDSDTSWGQKGMTLLTDLGKAVTSSFIEPAAAALGKFIKNELADLLSGKGLGGIGTMLSSIGDGFKTIFGAGGVAESSIKHTTDAAGAAASSGASGAGSGATSALGGLTGIVTMVSGVITAISSVIQNFQMMKMETTLNAIEWNTRKSSLHLQDTLEKANQYWPKLDDLSVIRWSGVGYLQGIEEGFWQPTGFLGRIAKATESIAGELVTQTGLLREVNVSVQATGVTTREAAEALGNQIAANLATQMVATSF